MKILYVKSMSNSESQDNPFVLLLETTDRIELLGIRDFLNDSGVPTQEKLENMGGYLGSGGMQYLFVRKTDLERSQQMVREYEASLHTIDVPDLDKQVGAEVHPIRSASFQKNIDGKKGASWGLGLFAGIVIATLFFGAAVFFTFQAYRPDDF